MGFKVLNLSDCTVEIAVPFSRFNRSEAGDLRTSSVIAGGEFGSQLLLRRHVGVSSSAEMTLQSLQCQFQRPAVSEVRLRAELREGEREKVLRKIRLGEQIDYEMPVVCMDSRDQSVADLTFIWRLKSLDTVALSQGRMS